MPLTPNYESAAVWPAHCIARPARGWLGMRTDGAGEAVISSGHDLPNDHVIHVLGPIYGVDKPASEYLTACHYQAIRLAARHGIASIAFPAVSTGAFGYPMHEAADMAIAATCRALADVSDVLRVRFVLFDAAAHAVYNRAIAAAIR